MARVFFQEVRCGHVGHAERLQLVGPGQKVVLFVEEGEYLELLRRLGDHVKEVVGHQQHEVVELVAHRAVPFAVLLLWRGVVRVRLRLCLWYVLALSVFPRSFANDGE